MIALAARRYDFTKVGIRAVTIDCVTGEPEVSRDGRCKVEEEMYMVSLSTTAG